MEEYDIKEQERRLDYNISYTNSWWLKAGKISSFFSFSERFHVYVDMLGLKTVADIRNDLYILDIGFGAGRFLKDASTKLQNGKESLLVGTDISFNTAAAFYKKVSADRDNKIFPVNTSAKNSLMPFKDGSFTMVCCSHVIEHVLDDKKLVEEIYRVLKPGGLALFQVPINEEDLNVPTHLRKYQSESFVTWMKTYFKVTSYGKENLFSHWVRVLGVSKKPFTTILKRTLIFSLSFIPIKMVFILDRLMLKAGFTPSQVYTFCWKEKQDVSDDSKLN